MDCIRKQRISNVSVPIMSSLFVMMLISVSTYFESYPKESQYALDYTSMYKTEIETIKKYLSLEDARLAMCIVAFVRNIIFMIDEKKNGHSDNITKKDIILLVIFYILIIVSTIFTYEGPLSLLSVIATMTYTYSVWQKKTNVYKFLGIPVGILWVLYNIYVKSIFFFFLESILLIASATGYILEKRKNK